MIVLVRWWPDARQDAGAGVHDVRGSEVIQVDEVRPTRHSNQLKPPPPAPLPPVVVADDVILEQEELDLTENFLPILENGVPPPPDGSGAPIAFEGPKPVRLVEPEYTRAAERRKVRAEVVVSVRVDARGRVQEARVIRRYLLGDSEGAPREVESLGYGLEEAAMAAAERCLFRPARRNGEAVESETTLSFGFGV